MNMDPMEQERAELAAINKKPFLTRFGFYAKKSGPGWMQGAITLGGGSLAGALYLGIISGYSLMWLQPLAMICGVIMLSAIGYVTLSTNERPFGSINRNISPLLGWSWLIATLMANIIWCMPQFNLGRAAVQQNLMPFLGESTNSTLAICAVFLIIALIINSAYGKGGKGIQIFERILKILVGIVVISFFLVVITLTMNGNIQWGQIFKGFIPNLSALFSPAPALADAVAQSNNADFWSGMISSSQRDKILAAFATAVGINMTFLLPYSMLKKRWGKEHRPLAIVDLSIGLIVPFVLATGCVLIAAAASFHGQTTDVLAKENVVAKTDILHEADGEGFAKGDIKFAAGAIITKQGEVLPKMAAPFHKILDGRLSKEASGKAALDALKEAKKGDDKAVITVASSAVDAARLALPASERNLAAMLANRDNFNLAATLAPLVGNTVAQIIFGIGVLGMAISTIIILMLINGVVFCEMFNKPGNKSLHMLGCLVSGIGGFFGPFLWTGDAKAALAIPTSVIGGTLLPIAYFTFFLMMNSKRILGDSLPTGGKRIVWNVLMLFATGVATAGSVWALYGKATGSNPLGQKFGWAGLVFLVVLFIVGIVGFTSKGKQYNATQN